MQGFYNYVNRQLCEYQSIFPNTARLLDHILFTIGTGLNVDIGTGRIYEGYAKDPCFIDEFPDMTDEGWEQLIKHCHIKERGFAERYTHLGLMDETRLAEQCAAYKRVAVDDSMFSEEYLYNTLRDTSNAAAADDDALFTYEEFVRPYPLSPGYANIFDLEDNTPKWFIQIARNTCQAWVRFLTEEIEQNHVCIKPESDYADLTWTTKHRNLLVEQVQRLDTLLKD